MRMRTAVFLVAALLVLVGCRKEENKSDPVAAGAPAAFSEGAPPVGMGARGMAGEATARGGLSGLVAETMDSGGYTYVRLENDQGSFWAAGPPAKVQVGDRVQLANGMLMKDFKSGTLERVFDEIYFVDSVQVVGAVRPVGKGSPESGGPVGEGPAPESIDLSGIARAEGGLTVAEVVGQNEKLVGRKVSVRARVVRVNRGIMDRNWLHLRDGTGDAELADLTVTSTGDAQVGDLVVVHGEAVRNPASFHGQSNQIILQDVTITVEATQ